MTTIKRWAARALVCAAVLAPSLAAATMVRMDTVRGPLDIELYDTQAPRTVANFLVYVREKAYDNSIVHRVARLGLATSPLAVLQGGGFYLLSSTGRLTSIPAHAPVQNEYSAERPNVRGSIAMAKLGGNPDSATSQWFVNLIDNTLTLGPVNNGGFTVFGRLTAPSLAVVDALAALPRIACDPPYGELPVLTSVACAALTADHLVLMPNVRELPARATDTASDRIFNYLEAAYPQYAAPASPLSGNALGYYYRYYTRTNVYAGTKDGDVYYLLPENNGVPQRLGSIAEWLAVATAAGY